MAKKAICAPAAKCRMSKKHNVSQPKRSAALRHH
jgi:hypothetical protein